MTTHAHHVAGQSNFRAVRLVTIDASYAFVKHATAEKRCELIILIAHLSIGVKQISFIHDGQQMMVEEVVAGLRIAGDLAASRVTRGAGVEHLIAGKFAEGGIVRVTFVGVLPIVVRLHRAVTGFATNAAFRHRGAEHVVGRVVIFPNARVVTGGAPRWRNAALVANPVTAR